VVLEKNGEDQLNRSVSNYVLRRVKGGRDIVQTVKTRKGNRIGHIWRRNCCMKHVTEGNIEGRNEGNMRKKT